MMSSHTRRECGACHRPGRSSGRDGSAARDDDATAV